MPKLFQVKWKESSEDGLHDCEYSSLDETKARNVINNLQEYNKEFPNVHHDLCLNIELHIKELDAYVGNSYGLGTIVTEKFPILKEE